MPFKRVWPYQKEDGAWVAVALASSCLNGFVFPGREFYTGFLHLIYTRGRGGARERLRLRLRLRLSGSRLHQTRLVYA